MTDDKLRAALLYHDWQKGACAHNGSERECETFARDLRQLDAVAASATDEGPRVTTCQRCGKPMTLGQDHRCDFRPAVPEALDVDLYNAGYHSGRRAVLEALREEARATDGIPHPPCVDLAFIQQAIATLHSEEPTDDR